MAVDAGADVRRTLDDIQQRLEPTEARSWAIDRLNEMFRTGRAPEPQPEGFLEGRLVTMSLTTPSDALVRRLGRMWMPWLGKSFDPAAQTGVNVLTKSARGPMRALWPNYVPERELTDRIEAFPFKTRIAPGEVDPDVTVLKIDYDSEPNPNLIIRRILDELVQVDDRLYLGKILFRRRGSWLPIGFFSLQS
ncbi:MAG: hypothetical protein ACRDKT_12115 [Actinomycetota bacterium]